MFTNDELLEATLIYMYWNMERVCILCQTYQYNDQVLEMYYVLYMLRFCLSKLPHFGPVCTLIAESDVITTRSTN